MAATSSDKKSSSAGTQGEGGSTSNRGAIAPNNASFVKVYDPGAPGGSVLVELAPVNPKTGAGEWIGKAPEYKVGLTAEGTRIEYVTEPKKEEKFVTEPKKEEKFVTEKKIDALASPTPTTASVKNQLISSKLTNVYEGITKSDFNKQGQIGYVLTPKTVSKDRVSYSISANQTGQVKVEGYRDWEAIALKLNQERFRGQQAVVSTGDDLAPNPAITGEGMLTIQKMIDEAKKNIEKDKAYFIPSKTLKGKELKQVYTEIKQSKEVEQGIRLTNVYEGITGKKTEKIKTGSIFDSEAIYKGIINNKNDEFKDYPFTIKVSSKTGGLPNIQGKYEPLTPFIIQKMPIGKERFFWKPKVSKLDVTPEIKKTSTGEQYSFNILPENLQKGLTNIGYGDYFSQKQRDPFLRYGSVGSIPYKLAKKEYDYAQKFEGGDYISVIPQFGLSIPLSFYRGVLTTEETIKEFTKGGLSGVGKSGVGSKVIEELVFPATTFRFFPGITGKVESLIPNVIKNQALRQFTGLTITGAALNPQTYTEPQKGFASSAIISAGFMGISRGGLKIGEYITPPRFKGTTELILKPQIETTQEGILFSTGKVQFPFGIEKPVNLVADVNIKTVSTKYQIPYMESQKLLNPAVDYFRASAPAELRQARYEYVFGKNEFAGRYLTPETTKIIMNYKPLTIGKAIEMAGSIPTYKNYLGLEKTFYSFGGELELYKPLGKVGFVKKTSEYYYSAKGLIKPKGKKIYKFKAIGGGESVSYGKEFSGILSGYQSIKGGGIGESLSVYTGIERKGSMRIKADYAKEFIGQSFSLKTIGGSAYQKALRLEAKDYGLSALEPINVKPYAKTKARLELFNPKDEIKSFNLEDILVGKKGNTVKVKKSLSDNMRETLNKISGVSEVNFRTGILNINIDTGYKSGGILKAYTKPKINYSPNIKETGFDKPMYGSKEPILMPGNVEPIKYTSSMEEILNNLGMKRTYKTQTKTNIKISSKKSKIVNIDVEELAITSSKPGYIKEINDMIFSTEKASLRTSNLFNYNTFITEKTPLKNLEKNKIRYQTKENKDKKVSPSIELKNKFILKQNIINRNLNVPTPNLTTTPPTTKLRTTLITPTTNIRIPRIDIPNIRTGITITEEPKVPKPKVPNIILPGIFFPFPDVKEGKKRKKVLKERKTKTRYVPTVAGIMSRIQEKKIKSIYSGFEIRGIKRSRYGVL